MSEHIESANAADELAGWARGAEESIQQLCRASLARPGMTPADVDIVLAHLAAAVAALPQAARQLSDILEQAKHEYLLQMDDLTETEDPGQAIDTARLHLDAIRKPALGLYRLLEAAHNETAHIAATDLRLAEHKEGDAQDIASRVRRPEDRKPPLAGPGGIGAPLSR